MRQISKNKSQEAYNMADVWLWTVVLAVLAVLSQHASVISRAPSRPCPELVMLLPTGGFRCLEFAFKNRPPWDYVPQGWPKKLPPILPQPRPHPESQTSLCQRQRPFYLPLCESQCWPGRKIPAPLGRKMTHPSVLPGQLHSLCVAFSEGLRSEPAPLHAQPRAAA